MRDGGWREVTIANPIRPSWRGWLTNHNGGEESEWARQAGRCEMMAAPTPAALRQWSSVSVVEIQSTVGVDVVQRAH